MTRRTTIWRTAGATLLALLCTASAGAQTLDQRPLSAAQVALFETPHLRNISGPTTLEYRFVRDGGPGGFSDRVTLRVGPNDPDGTKPVSFDFLSGERRVAYPPVEHFAGNPLLMLFLQHDVDEMKEQLGLSTTYFRNRIREAFVDHAAVVDTSLVLDGRTVPAREITVRPFADDKRLERLPSIQAKAYVFVVADGVPGALAELRTELPPDPAVGAPAFRERLTFEREHP